MLSSSMAMGCGLIRSIMIVVICMGMIVVGVNGQINTPCTNSIVSSFTPCFNYITGSGANGSSSPTQDCCDSLKSIMTNMIDCACLIITGNVPLSIPFVRTFVLSLPLQQCTSGVPVQCKGSGAPLSAPGPVLLTPAYSPQPPPSHHHHHHHHHARSHPPALSPHSSRVSKNSVAPSLAVEAPAKTVTSPPLTTDEQPTNKKSSPEASREKGTTPPMAPNPKNLPAGTSPLINPSKTPLHHQPNSSPISPSSHSLSPLLLFVPLSLIFL